MKKYKVKSLNILGTENRIFEAGDEVTSNDFEAGRAEYLEATGHLERLDAKSMTEAEKAHTIRNYQDPRTKVFTGKSIMW